MTTPILDQIRSSPEETPLSDLPPPFCPYGVELELSDNGQVVPWNTVLSWRTVADVLRTLEAV